MSQEKISKLFELKSQGLTDGEAGKRLRCDRRTIIRMKQEANYQELVSEVKADLLLNITSLQNRIIKTVNSFIDEIEKKKVDADILKIKTQAIKALAMFCNLQGEI